MVKVKVCGITNTDDAFAAVALGADALGFIFAPSPRRISPEDARNIIQAIPPLVKAVGVFVDQDPAEIKEIIHFCGIDLIQLHGDEPPGLCSEFMPFTIKAIRMRDQTVIGSMEQYRGSVRAMLLDTYSRESVGGTGKSFNWDLAVQAKGVGIPIILAGGLGPSNIAEAVSVVKPYAVDVNSGIEDRPGKKNHALLKELFENIRRIPND